MQINELNKKKYTDAELYASFLLTYLPRLKQFKLYPDTMIKKEAWRGDVLIRALDHAVVRPGIMMEFGVYKGDSIRVCAKRCPSRKFFGFDSFEGFPDDKRVDWQQDFSVEKMPIVPENVTLVPGYFSKSLPKFCHDNDFSIAFLNIDCDIYSSTIDVLFTLDLANKIKPGLVIYFDELINYKEAFSNELKALFELLEHTGLGISWLACHQEVRTIEQHLTLLGNGNYPTWKEDVNAGFRQQASLVFNEDGLDFSMLHYEHTRKRVKNVAKGLVANNIVEEYFL